LTLLAFIPARSGSKGIPKKNMVDLGGKPLIHYTLTAAMESSAIDYVFVSTDSDEIISYACALGLEVPYKRPTEVSGDETSMIETVMHGVSWLIKNGKQFDDIVLLQPTSPFRTAMDIDSAYDKFLMKGSHSLISVHKMIEHPYECTTSLEEGWTMLAKPSIKLSRRQDYAKDFFFINGGIYIASISILLKYKTFIFEGKTCLHEMSQEHGTDIDTPYDLKIASAILENQ